MAWKSLGNPVETSPLLQTLLMLTVKTYSLPMEAKEFYVFRTLLADVYSKAFGEPISKLPHGKAQTLCWLIHETTGELLSYKTLGNYVEAVLSDNPYSVNPCNTTLAILAKFVAGNDGLNGRHEMRMGAYAPWYKYRNRVLTRLIAA